ncbi:hypothetical protein TTHERM_00576750 (macronuclear) [Tetrahymena thermophila SB210]|uniref:Uncharacterized protein n=1 Tax=Tetrahymena thermophila (strain SB210) TaxID=312017 RepID=Q22V24_TETTS|nr:hypothetical protein TTHERM_00576750 [Tetrahymena thermophila SB210]EAR89124.2 hypothetical protein TTHERM_00576750 [Tetrahymena thermophila SB210]|eukprot:XP_001009369.2 hypothetical protein TTHERM_00576750 [Tetrahymena thermophila SB210]
MYAMKRVKKQRSKTIESNLTIYNTEKVDLDSCIQIKQVNYGITNRNSTPSPSSRQNNQYREQKMCQQQQIDGLPKINKCLTDKYVKMNQSNEPTNSFYLNEDKDVINNQSQVINIRQQTRSLFSTSSFIASSMQNNQLKASASQGLSITNQLQKYQIKSKELFNCKQKQSNHNSFLSNQLSNKKKKSISNIAFTAKTADSLQSSQEKKLFCVEAKNNQNSTFLKIMSKSLLNTSISDDQLSYEEGYNRKISSSFKNICENEGAIFMDQKKLKNSINSSSFLENSYKHSGYSNYANSLLSPFLMNSDIIDESCIPERCQNPLSKDIQFLNLSNQESNFEELKKKILFEEDLSDFEL